jgi:hypothetical protein
MADSKPVEQPKTEPQLERPRIEGNWMKAVGNALLKKKHAPGWPEPPGRYGNKKTRAKSK